MIGRVAPDLDATLPLRLRAQDGNEVVTVLATIDTGFTEFLLLTRSIVSTLGLPTLEQDSVVLGDGSTALLDVHEVEVEWLGGWRLVEAYAGEDDMLIGVSLLEGYRLSVDFVPGGEVRVIALDGA